MVSAWVRDASHWCPRLSHARWSSETEESGRVWPEDLRPWDPSLAHFRPGRGRDDCQSANWILLRVIASNSSPFYSFATRQISEAQFDRHARTLLGLEAFSPLDLSGCPVLYRPSASR